MVDDESSRTTRSANSGFQFLWMRLGDQSWLRLRRLQNPYRAGDGPLGEVKEAVGAKSNKRLARGPQRVDAAVRGRNVVDIDGKAGGQRVEKVFRNLLQKLFGRLFKKAGKKEARIGLHVFLDRVDSAGLDGRDWKVDGREGKRATRERGLATERGDRSGEWNESTGGGMGGKGKRDGTRGQVRRKVAKRGAKEKR